MRIPMKYILLLFYFSCVVIIDNICIISVCISIIIINRYFYFDYIKYFTN